MQPNESALTAVGSALRCLLGNLVGHLGGSDPLRKVASPIVALHKQASVVPAPRRLATMPDIGNEEGHITGPGDDRDHASAIPVEIVVAHPVPGRR